MYAECDYIMKTRSRQEKRKVQIPKSQKTICRSFEVTHAHTNQNLHHSLDIPIPKSYHRNMRDPCDEDAAHSILLLTGFKLIVLLFICINFTLASKRLTVKKTITFRSF